MSILVCECLSVVEAKLSEQNDSQIKAFSEDVLCKIVPRSFLFLFSFIVIICRELKCGNIVPPAGKKRQWRHSFINVEEYFNDLRFTVTR